MLNSFVSVSWNTRINWMNDALWHFIVQSLLRCHIAWFHPFSCTQIPTNMLSHFHNYAIMFMFIFRFRKQTVLLICYKIDGIVFISVNFLLCTLLFTIYTIHSVTLHGVVQRTLVNYAGKHLDWASTYIHMYIQHSVQTYFHFHSHFAWTHAFHEQWTAIHGKLVASRNQNMKRLPCRCGTQPN